MASGESKKAVVLTAAGCLRELRSLGDADDAAFLRRFFKTGPGEYGEGDKLIGVRVPVSRKVAKKYADLSETEVFKLLRSPWHEARLVALFVLVAKFRRGDEAVRRRIYDGYLAHTEHVNNWDLVDSSAEHIVGPWLEQRSRKPLYKLARSEQLWERRIAIIATLHFIWNDEFQDTFAIADILLDDEHDLIHKATGWMLREVGKRSRPQLVEWLGSRYRRMPRTMLRYAIEKFPARDRQRYLKGRV